MEEDDENSLLMDHYGFYRAISGMGERLGIEDNLKPRDLNYFKDLNKSEIL